MHRLGGWSVALWLVALSLPPPSSAQTTPETSPQPAPDGPCADLVATAVAAARRDELVAGERALTTARRLCPADPRVTLELAALRFRQERFADAARLADQVLAHRPQDVFAWELLAASRFLLDDDGGALRAWNRLGRPVHRHTRVTGAHRTRPDALLTVVGVRSGELITPSNLRRARRRVAALPAVSGSRIDYRPIEGGQADITVAIVEPPVFGRGWPDLLQHAVRAAVDARLRLDLAAPLGAGELWTGEWRWQRSRRGLALGFATAGLPGFPALLELRAALRTSMYRVPVAGPAAGATLRETSRSLRLTASDWASGTVWWLAGGSVDRWEERGTFIGVAAAVDVRRGDRAAARTDVGTWWSPGRDDPFQAARLQASVRSRTAGVEWTLRAGVARSSGGSPRELWPSVGTGRGGGALLRAHPLLDGDGVVRGPYLAPLLGHASLELWRWMRAVGPLRVGAAAFLDAAAVRGPADDPLTSVAIDAGAGIRLDVPGLAAPLRADLARGLVDGAAAFSAGWMPTWPGWW